MGFMVQSIGFSPISFKRQSDSQRRSLLFSESASPKLPVIDHSSYAHFPQLTTYLRDLPNPTKPFDHKNLQFLKTLKTNSNNEDFNKADKSLAGLVALVSQDLALQLDPIDYLLEIEEDKFMQAPENIERIETRINQLKSTQPKSKRTHGAYDNFDRNEVRALTPFIALTAIDAFIEDRSLQNIEHDKPESFKLTVAELAQVLHNLFLLQDRYFSAWGVTDSEAAA